MKSKIQYIFSLIAFSLTLSYGALAQTATTTSSQKIGANPTSISPSAVLEVESDNKGVLFPRIALGSSTDVSKIASPATGLTIFNTATAGTSPNAVTPGYYYWNGSKWVKIAIETPFAKTVYVNATSPSTATIFDENNPPSTNDNTLKANDNNVYIGADGSTWTYDPTGTGTYKTYVVPASTPFNLAGTTTDAGKDKTSAIWRSGRVGIGGTSFTPSVPLEVQSSTVSSFTSVAKFLAPSNTTAGNATQLNFGTAGAKGNSSEWRFVYQGNDAANNRVDFGMSGYITPMISYLRSGNVGIGISNPVATLDVNSPTAATQAPNADVTILKLSRPTSSGTKFGNVAQFNLGTYAQLGATAYSRMDLTMNDGLDVSTMSPVMTWQANGFVGVGINAPTVNLDVKGGGLFRNGNDAGVNTKNQILFGYNGSSNYTHSIRTRHQGSLAFGNAIDFYTWTNANAASAIGTKHVFTIDGSGSVGIGTTSPTSTIHAINPLAATKTVNADAQVLRISRPATSGQKWDNIAQFDLGSYSDANTFATSRLDLGLTDGDNNTVISKVMTWQGNGNVGIGTTAPQSLFHVKGATGGITLERTAGTAPYDQAFLKMINKDGGAFQLRNISGTSDGFTITNGIASTNYITGLSSGNIGIGTTSPGYKLDVSGDINASGSVRAAGTALTSDLRLKSNIVNLSSGLSKIMQLRPVNYDKKMSLDSASNSVNENGFIAQELQKVMPELVSEGKDKDKLLSVNYTAIIPVLTKAVQEQQKIIEQNQATIQKQQEQINELKLLLEKLLEKK